MQPYEKYVIINTTDRPEKRMVCEIIDGKLYYMSRAYEPYKKEYDGMTPRAMTTPVSHFGFTVVEREYQVDFLWNGTGSTAKYEDGSPRFWQGESEFSLPRVILEKKNG